MANETVLYFRAETADNKFDEFSMVIPGIAFTEKEWDLFKQMLPRTFESMSQMAKASSSEEKATVSADMEVVKAAE